ncbi:cupin domain-containing protein [Roseisalinus antarcticus]|uniref:HTH-type transcriptional regulator PuuR n=1 Tax=Roseisalinus antarcticus TaxID=254357 RepID=A0A1Y5TVD9_9RHOB|nr:cupin domain-containing protein [Roseisalinus antarcticus]SLN70648.1 HTH-type transcriptional regulator PuuR [Roseisalinus antarcticus]
MPSEMGPLQPSAAAQKTITVIGKRIREMRKDKGMTLSQLAEASGLSSSMLSLVERGLASPSIGSLIVVAGALGRSMSDLLETESHESDIVVRSGDVTPVQAPGEVIRRVMKEDRANGVSIAVNEYAPHTSSNESALSHEGYEYGLLLDGSLTVEVGGEAHVIEAGDLISYSSRRPHRIYNHTDRMARTVWVNTDRR